MIAKAFVVGLLSTSGALAATNRKLLDTADSGSSAAPAPAASTSQCSVALALSPDVVAAQWAYVSGSASCSDAAARIEDEAADGARFLSDDGQDIDCQVAVRNAATGTQATLHVKIAADDGDVTHYDADGATITATDTDGCGGTGKVTITAIDTPLDHACAVTVKMTAEAVGKTGGFTPDAFGAVYHGTVDSTSLYNFSMKRFIDTDTGGVDALLFFAPNGGDIQASLVLKQDAATGKVTASPGPLGAFTPVVEVTDGCDGGLVMVTDMLPKGSN